MSERICSKALCKQPAVATLSYDYSDSVAVLGGLSFEPEPGCFDLCLKHARTLTPPEGWQLVRHQSLQSAPKDY